MSQLVPMYRVEKILQDKYPTKPGGPASWSDNATKR